MGEYAELSMQDDDIGLMSHTKVGKPSSSEWMTRDGEIMNIKDMSTQHLDNSIALLERKTSKLWRLKFEKLKRFFRC